MERRSNRQKKGVNYRIDNQSSDSEDDFVPSSKKPKAVVGAATAPKRSSREERLFNKELDSALKASLSTPGTAEGTRSGQQNSAVADQGHLEVTVTTKGTSNVASKEVCHALNSTGPQQRNTIGCVSVSTQSDNDSCDDTREPPSWSEEVKIKSPSQSMSDGDDCIGKSVSTEAKLKGDRSRTASECAKGIAPKNSVDSAKPDSTSTKPSGVKKATVSAGQLQCKPSSASHPSVRVGLSRNIHIKPLHPKLKTVLQ